MIRYTIFIAAILASAATAIASLPARQPQFIEGRNTTNLVKNIEWTAGPLIVEACAKEDCSDTAPSQ